uniref:G-protein coupled receptors family 3 profile domain-containing protein n=1 Tax=Xenopus tropicalis TaxID=8364 RepID=A0A1B8YAM2_XENTR
MEILFPIKVEVLLVVLMLQILPVAAAMPNPSSTCQLSSIRKTKYFREGDLMVGGIFHIKLISQYTVNERFNRKRRRKVFRRYRYLLAFIFTIGEINKDPRILPNHTLGYHILESCNEEDRTIKSTFSILSGRKQIIPNYSCWNNRKVVGFIGDLSTGSSLCIAQLAGVYRYPQISYGARDTMFSDRVQFPSFYRTLPDELSEINGIAKLIKHFGWKWVGLITSDDEDGELAGNRMERAINKDGGCLAFLSRINHNSFFDESVITSPLRESTANVIVLLVTLKYINSAMLFFSFYPIPKKIWIVSSSFLRILDTRAGNRIPFNGLLVISFQKGEIPGFREFLYGLNLYQYENSLLFQNVTQRLSDCTQLNVNPNRPGISLPKYTESEFFSATDLQLNNTLNYRITYGVYTAVYTMALALHKLFIKQKMETEESLQTHFKQWRVGACVRMCVKYTRLKVWRSKLQKDPLSGKPLLPSILDNGSYTCTLNSLIQNEGFEMPSGDIIHFKENGGPPARYDILKGVFSEEGDIQITKVASFDASKPEGSQLDVNNIADLWGPYFKEFPQSRCSEPCRAGQRIFKLEGKPSCCYKCVPCVEGDISNTTDAQSCIKCSKYEKPNNEKTECIPRNINFLSYEDTLGATLSFITLILFGICAVILGIFIKYRKTPIVRANNQYLSCLLLISLMLCFLCTLLFIGRPTQICCLLRQVTFGIVFTISVSSVLAKTLTVIIAFNATKPGSKLKKYVGTQLAIILVIVCSLVEVVISAVWLASNPPFPEADTLSDPDYIILLCNEGSELFFFCIIGYIGTLALLSFIVAFLAKDFPDRFNEAKNITFSMLGFCSVWGAFVPAYLSSKGSRMVAVEIFAILSSSAGLLGCIFIPKCYIIFLRPELNTKDTVVRKL